MCGIFGYVGERKDAAQLVMGGLRQLEYRGYDSWGVAVAAGMLEFARGQRHRLRRTVMVVTGVCGCNTLASEQLDHSYGLRSPAAGQFCGLVLTFPPKHRA